MVHLSAALAIERDPEDNHPGRLGLRRLSLAPSEKMGMPTQGARDALPTLAYVAIVRGGAGRIPVASALFYPGRTFAMVGQLAGPPWRARLHADRLDRGRPDTDDGAAAGSIVYFRDNYRASNFGVPDLIQVIRAIDAEIVRQHEEGGVTGPLPRIQLSFIGHSMGGYVVTNAIRTLSDVFAVPVDALNSYGAGSPQSQCGQRSPRMR